MQFKTIKFSMPVKKIVLTLSFLFRQRYPRVLRPVKVRRLRRFWENLQTSLRSARIFPKNLACAKHVPFFRLKRKDSTGGGEKIIKFIYLFSR